MRCPAILLVICTDAPVARWCEGPIEMGHPGLRLVPIVIGPQTVPVVVDPLEAARVPELAVLSAVAHGAGVDAQPILEALISALTDIDEDRSRLYADFVLMMLPEVARKHMEGLMATGTYEYQSDFAKKYVAEGKLEGKAQGKVEGKAEAIFIVLYSRGVSMSPESRSRIEACTDAAQLDEWIQRSATAKTVDDLFSRTG